jgi:glycolate oxidase FAD binding subunit
VDLQEQIHQAWKNDTPLCIRGGGSKSCLGHKTNTTDSISTKTLNGIIDYQPAELFIRARAGTPLRDIQALLVQQGQKLPFEPPAYSDTATLGGSIASGLSGTCRPWTGAARDFVLGCTLINGKGERLRFGGEVIKNVAGYDVSRLQCGAFGTLGLLLDLSIRTIPLPEYEITLRLECSEANALPSFIRWNQQSLPVSGGAWHDGSLWLHLSGAEASVIQARGKIGGEQQADNLFWQQLNDHQLGFFQNTAPRWCISVPPATPALPLPGDCLVDWAGARRWLNSNADADQIQQLAASAGGYALSYNNQPMPPLPPGLMALHQRLKKAFDPRSILNPNRLYPGL